MTLPKYIFVTGGVTSSLGKGIISASLGLLLKSRGYNVTIQKLDPYINVDSGTLNPYEHGECYVTQDGFETDLDLGHYERFLNKPTSQYNNVTSGKIYQHIINKERKGDFLGKTVQVVPHITDEIKRRIKILGDSGKYDIVITEVGGTVGDIESLPFIESVRQLHWELQGNSVIIHLTLLPYLSSSGELKTKPSQHSVRLLMKSGIQANILVCRTEYSITKSIKEKLSLFCNIKSDNVIECKDVDTIYEVPNTLLKQKFDKVVLKELNLNIKNKADLFYWNVFLNKYKNPKYKVEIALIGKYVTLQDSYKSIVESFIHAGAFLETKIKIRWIDSETIKEENVYNLLSNLNGILIAPGFGDRGIDGKICAAKFARLNNIPTFGICLGMHIMVIEFARNVLNYNHAESMEFNSGTLYPVIHLIKEQKKILYKGGTMRLGNWKCFLKPNTLAYSIYKSNCVEERHRHRYEFNNDYLYDFENYGFIACGINKETKLVEILELNYHNFYLGVQFHPEYSSTVEKPHVLFISFIKASLKFKNLYKRMLITNINKIV